jgi:copper transport outer membrane protein MctB
VFDLRYHVASLAAVFFALIIGILVGVALASHGLGNTERDRLQADLRRAEARSDGLQSKVDALEDNGAANAAFVDKTYKVVMADRLQGARIAVLFIGPVDPDVQAAITAALGDTGGDQLRLRVLKVPINERALAQRLREGRPFLQAYAGDRQLDDLGQALGQEFAAGIDTPLWNALETLIVERRDGPLKRPADGVVVVRTVSAQTGATARFLKGIYQGLKDVGIPAVGVELTTSDSTAVTAFKKAGLSTVDDLDQPTGRLALAILLSDPSVSGNFGTKNPPSDDGRLPNVVPVPAITTGG